MAAGNLGAYSSPEDIARAVAMGALPPDQINAAIRASGLNTNNTVIMDMARGFHQRPPANTGAVGDTRQPPSMEDISSLLLGRLPFAQRQAVAHQFGIVPSGQGFQMDALNALINRGSLEGAPPAPFETKFANTPALVDALLTRRVDPRVLDRAKSGLLKQMQAAQTVPPSLLRGR